MEVRDQMRPIIGISMGDPAGIGPEISAKALLSELLYENSIPVVIGDLRPIEKMIETCELPLNIHLIHDVSEAYGKPGTIDVLDMNLLHDGEWHYGEVSAAAGNAAFHYVKKGIELAMEGKTAALVTGPLNKEALNCAGHHFSGHTEILAHYTGTKDYAMMLTAPGLRVIHATTHVSMRNACDRITKERVYKVIRLAYQAMLDLGIKNPRIGVAGLNAHCSENGLFGDEEARAISPAVEQARMENLDVQGPIPPDTVFVKALAGQYDVVVAMYHDQGHIPLKLIGFRADAQNQFSSVQGVNMTVGLPIIRTSVDHGTAFDKAGKGISNADSMVDAYQTAVTLARNKI